MLTDLLADADAFRALPEDEQARLVEAKIRDLSQAELVKLERAGRIQASNSMAAYVDYMELGVRPATHHKALIAALEAVERGKIDRLMVLMPPGSAKSTYTSAVFPAWYLGRNPKKSIIAASHTQDLIERFGRRARNLYASPLHRAVFGVGVSKDSGAAARWDTEAGGEYFAVGIGGAVAGRRADVGSIDDPVRGHEDADSERVRDKTWDWYINDYLTRLKPGAAQIIVMTRWHEDDLGGRVLAMEGDRWHVLKFPFEAGNDDPLGRAPGERLWPEWFTEKMMEDAKRDRRSWNALYQQEPTAEEGDYFRADWFRDADVRPEKLSLYGASDYAATEGGGDYTEHGIFGIDSQGNVHVLDWWYGQNSPDVWIETQCDLMVKHKPLCWFGESGPIRRSTEPFLIKRMDERNINCRIEWLPSIHEKDVRCRPFQALSASGKVFWPPFAPWKSRLQGQLLRFPAGMHDDGVDVCSLIGRGLEHVRPPRVSVGDRQSHAVVAHAPQKSYSPQYRGGARQLRANLGYAQR